MNPDIPSLLVKLFGSATLLLLLRGLRRLPRLRLLLLLLLRLLSWRVGWIVGWRAGRSRLRISTGSLSLTSSGTIDIGLVHDRASRKSTH